MPSSQTQPQAMASSPPKPPSVETRWVLARAFFPPDFEVELPSDPVSVWPEAVRFRVAARIASRCGTDRLVRELGEPIAELFMQASRTATLQALKVEAQVRHLAAVAERDGLSFAVLKGAALHLLRITAPSARPLCDLDILMRAEDAKRLQGILRDQGWEATTRRRVEYHLRPLMREAWLPLEIHYYLPWVALNGRTWSTFEQLTEAGLLHPLPSPLGHVLAPAPEVLVSHAVVAGTHLSALGIADVVEVGRADRGLVARPSPNERWLRPVIGSDQLALVQELVDDWHGLESSRPPDRTAVERWIARAAALQGRFVGASRPLLRPFPGSPIPWQGLFLRLLSRVLVSNRELAGHFGAPCTPLLYPVLHVRRLLHVAWRVLTGREVAQSGWGHS